MLKNLLAKYNNFVQNASLKTLIRFWLIFCFFNILVTYSRLGNNGIYYYVLFIYISVIVPMLPFSGWLSFVKSSEIFWSLNVFITSLVFVHKIIPQKYQKTKQISQKISYAIKYFYWIYIVWYIITDLSCLLNNIACKF